MLCFFFSFLLSRCARSISFLVSRYSNFTLTEVEHNYWGFQLLDYKLDQISDQRLEGCTVGTVSGFGGAIAVLCFVIEFGRPFLQFHRTEAGGTASFNSSAREPLLVRVGTSRVDLQHARAALEQELQGKDFEEIRNATRSAWDVALGVIQARIEPSASRAKSMFYSALYHCMIAPYLLSDSDGSYRLESPPAGKSLFSYERYFLMCHHKNYQMAAQSWHTVSWSIVDAGSSPSSPLHAARMGSKSLGAEPLGPKSLTSFIC